MSLKQPLWTKNFLLICVANLMVFTSFYFLLPTLPVFVTEVLKGDESILAKQTNLHYHITGN
ncbi:hypothetical protein SY88_02625 [Clostridiales bacterium PH28_bin88]|nr:hypothetical protein SY88_02625 [Clostridiales bacterium PH28_bin88]